MFETGHEIMKISNRNNAVSKNLIRTDVREMLDNKASLNDSRVA